MNRTEFIQHIINQIGTKSYLEVGTQYCTNFNKIECIKKVGVDPGDFEGEYKRMTSDDYFAECSEVFDVIFIDGLHHADQALKDVKNALAHIQKNGIIIMHDCNPYSKETQEIPETHMAGWTGNVWRAFLNMRRFKELTCICFDVCTGMGFVQIVPCDNFITLTAQEIDDLTYEDFDANRKELLNLQDENYFKNILFELPKI